MVQGVRCCLLSRELQPSAELGTLDMNTKSDVLQIQPREWKQHEEPVVLASEVSSIL